MVDTLVNVLLKSDSERVSYSWSHIKLLTYVCEKTECPCVPDMYVLISI